MSIGVYCNVFCPLFLQYPLHILVLSQGVVPPKLSGVVPVPTRVQERYTVNKEAEPWLLRLDNSVTGIETSLEKVIGFRGVSRKHLIGFKFKMLVLVFFFFFLNSGSKIKET